MTSPASGTSTQGIALGIVTYTLWGLIPLYLRLFNHVPPEQVVAHRVIWSLALLALVVVLLRRARGLVAAVRGRTLLLLIASASLIGANWLLFTWAVASGHVVAASLGFFITPLMSVALGMAVLGERMRRGQAVAVGFAAAGVALTAIGGGWSIWVALALALTFSLYGLVRKIVAVDALGGLTVETVLMAPFALVFLVHVDRAGMGAWGPDTAMNLMLVSVGAVTTVPLLMFAAAARRLPLSTLGLLQYIAPTIQFLLAVLVFGEPLRTAYLVAFGLIWSGCALYAWDSLRAVRAVPPV